MVVTGGRIPAYAGMTVRSGNDGRKGQRNPQLPPHSGCFTPPLALGYTGLTSLTRDILMTLPNPSIGEPELRRPAAAIPAEHGIITGDAAIVLKQLRAAGELFEVIIADPPYNIGKDFGNNQDARPLADYIQWTQGWLADCFQLLAPAGLIYLYGFPEIVARIAAQYPIDEQRWLVWHYTNKTVPAARFWQRSHETILCLWRPGSPRPALEIDRSGSRTPQVSSAGPPARNAGIPPLGSAARAGAPFTMPTPTALCPGM